MKTSATAVSVVLPTYNRLASLPDAVASVLSQSYRDLELLVVDDGSIDGTVAWLRSLLDERVRLITLPVRIGAPAARNVGLSQARGRFVAFQDSDDTWRPGKLQAQVALLADAPDDVAVVYGGVVRHLPAGDLRIPRSKDVVLNGDLSRLLTFGNFIALPAALVRAAALDEVGGFDTRLPRFQDWDLWLQLSRQHRFRYLDRVVVDSAETAGSITSDRAAYFEALGVILEKHVDLFDRTPQAALGYRLQLARRALETHRPGDFRAEMGLAWASAGWRTLPAIARRLVSRGTRVPSSGTRERGPCASP